MSLPLLEKLCSVHAPSGNELAMTRFLLEYINKNKHQWTVQPEIFSGEGFQNCIVLIFGEPETAVFAHIDSIGFTVRYDNHLVKIGSPHLQVGTLLTGQDSKGAIEGKLKMEKDLLAIDFEREIDRGTDLVFKADFREDEDYVQCCYMDNRLGVYNALRLAETLRDGAIVFSCWEEHGGGSVGYLAKFLHEKYNIKQALISDITWATEGVHPGEGIAISMRDSGIPRRSYVNRIIDIARNNKITFQIEVEGSGGSDGNELQKSPFPFDWCFVGAPEENVHSADEKVHKKDIESMLEIYQVLMKEL
ncbi:MAG: M20/M25/M40 family metallo-hydrolase [Nitrosopumilus sp.]|nr:M20/M25/M40 family metallo-hydrolase [Nitrosopumilus sp.]